MNGGEGCPNETLSQALAYLYSQGPFLQISHQKGAEKL